MPDVLTEKLGFLCLNCNYPLRGLVEPRCPECGRPFDPTDATTMNIGRPLSSWCRARLRPPNQWFNAVAVVAGVWTLAAWSGPDAYLLMLLGALGLWLLIGVWWALRAALWVLIAALKRQPHYWHQWSWLRWTVAPLVAAVVIGLLALRGPFRAAFLVSRPALEARARALLDGTDSSALATRPGWIGLFPIDSIEHQGEAVYFWVAGVGFFDRYGLTYSPSGQWPAKSGCSYRSWGRQTWRVCHEDW